MLVVHQSRMAGCALDTACKSGPIDFASFATRTPGKYMKSHSGVASIKHAAFFSCANPLRCEKVVTISGQHPIETRESGCQTHELSGVTVKISTTRVDF